jgi:hypothetical protein
LRSTDSAGSGRRSGSSADAVVILAVGDRDQGDDGLGRTSARHGARHGPGAAPAPSSESADEQAVPNAPERIRTSDLRSVEGGPRGPAFPVLIGNSLHTRRFRGRHERTARAMRRPDLLPPRRSHLCSHRGPDRSRASASPCGLWRGWRARAR